MDSTTDPQKHLSLRNTTGRDEGEGCCISGAAEDGVQAGQRAQQWLSCHQMYRLQKECLRMQLMLRSPPPKVNTTPHDTPHNTVRNPAMPISRANAVHDYVLRTTKCCQALVLYTCCMHIKFASCDQWHCWPPDHMRICRCTHAPVKPDTITAKTEAPLTAQVQMIHAPKHLPTQPHSQPARNSPCSTIAAFDLMKTAGYAQ